MPTAIYHITHVDNLRAIIGQGGLWCDSERLDRRLDPVGIAHQHIKDRRARRGVPAAAGGTLADYVPFYFAPRSPMLYAISCGAVAGYAGTQSDVVHLCSTVEAIQRAALPFAFTDGHADMEISDFFEDVRHLDRIDWPIMQATYWRDTITDGDRKRRRQAEFLVHRFLPWACVSSIGAMNRAAADRAADALRGAAHCPPVQMRSAWYY